MKIQIHNSLLLQNDKLKLMRLNQTALRGGRYKDIPAPPYMYSPFFYIYDEKRFSSSVWGISDSLSALKKILPDWTTVEWEQMS